MTDHPVDLGPLDPTRDRARFDSIVRGIVADARRPDVVPLAAASPWWWRGAMAAAAAIVIAAVPTLLLVRVPPAQATPAPSLIERAGIPRPLAQWAGQNHMPTVGELVSGLGHP